ncbi:MAG TPA: hypothetical protein VGC13_05690 [Longimicrobium sp.]|jgi:hypothetical protein|uniref:hypothetical protein n=1 Tax=Longimicrobium sp. TaxID=2029185 RepID=UPI002ED8D2CB
MKPLRIPTLLRVAFAALAVLLAGCDDGPTTPDSLTGNWLAVLEQGSGQTAMRVEDRLELTDDGRYVWTTVAFGPEGRSQDGMVAWYSRSGDWGVEGDRLALRTMGGMAWEHDRGSSQLDYMPEWNQGHRLRVEGTRLLLTELPPPERSLAARTYVFQRTTGSFGAPQP